MVLVGVGEDDALDPVGVLPQVGEVGQDEVDAGHVGVGEHDPAVVDEDPALDLDADAVAADLAEPAEEDDPDRVVCGRSFAIGRRLLGSGRYRGRDRAGCRAVGVYAAASRSFATSSSVRVLLAGVDPVLELDHAELGELLRSQPSPASSRPSFLQFGTIFENSIDWNIDAALVLDHEAHRLLHVDAHLLPHLLLQEAVAHADRGLERELLALADLLRVELLVELLEREHAERDVARLVAHHVAEQLLQQRLGGELVDEAERGEREALDHDLHAEVGHVPPGVA